MENKQTAVEWAEDQLSNLNSSVVSGEIAPEEYHKIRVGIWEKAKLMEKKEHQRIADKAREDGWREGKYVQSRW
jgi:hypothetical protein